jgi:Arc/MetJ family transcription regulator
MTLSYAQEVQMRTTLNIDDSLLHSITKHTGITNKTEIINTALSDYLGKLRRQNLMNAYGKIDLDLDVRELRDRELVELKESYD